MRIVVTGEQGQVVRSLIERGPGVVPLGRPRLDLAWNVDEIEAAIAGERPDVIVSAAAYTAVDKAESEPGLAFAVNEQGAAAIARAASRIGVPLIHMSTDYVFDGTKDVPYVEKDETFPTGVYGASKLAGEKAVMTEYENVVILRTAWVYSPFGANFVKTMLRLAGEREMVRVVADQRGNPTSGLDIADGILAVASNLAKSNDPVLRGVFHMSGSGEASWAEFAEEIFAATAAAGRVAVQVVPIATSDYPTSAKRPANSCLDCSKLAQAHGIRLPQWRRSTGEVVARLLHVNT